MMGIIGVVSSKTMSAGYSPSTNQAQKTKSSLAESQVQPKNKPGYIGSDWGSVRQTGLAGGKSSIYETALTYWISVLFHFEVKCVVLSGTVCGTKQVNRSTLLPDQPTFLDQVGFVVCIAGNITNIAHGETVRHDF